MVKKSINLTKKHFVVLDGMRGVAALAVGSLHASQIFGSSFQPKHAFLAVDFFFMLSGFVVAYAYGERLEGGGLKFSSFVKLRLVRLYPMILVGVFLGSAVTLISAIVLHRDIFVSIIFSISAIFLIPSGLLFKQQAYPVNNPIWSLFFEIFASIFYALQMKWSGGRYILSIAVFCGILFIPIIYRYNTVEHIGFDGKLLFVLGTLRVLFPFLLGVLIFKANIKSISLDNIPYILIILLVIVLFIPFIDSNYIYDIVAIYVLFPIFIILGTENIHNKFLLNTFNFLGSISYPFYLIHQPILRFIKHSFEKTDLHLMSIDLASFFSLLFCIFASYLMLIIYDQPIRGWLTRKFSSISQ